NLNRPVRRLGLHAGNLPLFFDESGYLRPHTQVEGRVLLAVLGKEVEEVPLRHEGDEVAAGWQVGEVGDRDRLASDVAGELTGLLVRALQERLQKSEFVHHFQGRGVDGVAAEVPEEVAVLFEDEDIHAGAGEQIAEHHPGGPSAHDTTAYLNLG